MFGATHVVAAPPYATNMCAADRVSNLNCTANDIEVASVQVLNNVTTCVAGTPVSLDLRAYLHLNSHDRHDIGIFMAKDARSPIIPSSSGGSADCAVFGLPQSPSPFANLDGNACGDFDRDSLPQGFQNSLDLGTVVVTCSAGPDGYLDIPTVISWQTSGTPTSCQSPPEAWVEPGSPSKCEAGIAARIDVQVLGRIVVTKQTVPAAAPGSFSFSASGAGVAPTSFSLTDGQSQTVTTGPLGATAQQYVITEQALTGFGPGAQIQCVDEDGDIAPFVTIDNVNRRITANLSAAFSQTFCTVTNTQQASITINKATLGGDGTFNFTGSPDISPFAISTVGGAGQTVIGSLTPGAYSIAELVPTGWDLTALTCVDPTSDSSVNLATATAAINLSAGENVTCTFTDTRRASITVVKQTAGGDGTFDFAGPGNVPFQITTSGGTAQTVFSNLPPGSYTVSESVPVGWDLTALTCVDPSGGTSTAPPSANIGLAPGENVTCTFSDTRRGSIVVQKQTLGGDGTFNFVGSQAFSITTGGGFGSDTSTYASVASGSYTITETVPTGWSLTNLVCVDPTTDSSVNLATQTATANVGPGETITCTFTDTRLATLVVLKQAVPHIAQPNTPSFPFTATGLTPASFSLSDDGVNPNSITFANLTPGGTYSVVEGTVPNWLLTAIDCSDANDPNPANRTSVNVGTGTVLPNLQPGETLECVFTNVRNDNGTITVTKTTVGGGATFAFTNSGGTGTVNNPNAFNITTTAQNPTGSQQLTSLAAGTFTITETPLAGWDLGPIQCVQTSGTSSTFSYTTTSATVNLGITGGNVDGVACSFTNTLRGSITIAKAATPKDVQNFAFTATGGNGVPANFTLRDDATVTPPNTLTFAALPNGAYTFTEQPVAGWKLTAIDCNGGSAVTTDTATGLATIDLQPGENVTCTYANSKDATITVSKTAVGGSGGETFAFSGPPALTGSIGDGQSLSGGFAAGTYSVTEQIPPGWDLSNIVCSGGTVTITGALVNPTPNFEFGDTTVNITVQPGDVVSCTYTDTRRGAIAIVKNTLGGDGTFAFTGSQSFSIATNAGTGQDTTTFADIAPGTYTVTEAAVAGWQLTALSCTAGGTANPGASTATINLAAGQSVTCTFTNTRAGSITIIKRIHDDETTGFPFTVPVALDPTQTFTLTPPIQGAQTSRAFSDVPPGSYVVTEQVPAGWTSLGVDCVDPTQDSIVNLTNVSATIALAAGESVTCTFDDTTLAQITISVVSSGGTGTFGFSSTNFGADDFELTTPMDGMKSSRVFAGLPPNAYSVLGLGSAGWTLYDVQCFAVSGETYWTINTAAVGITLPHGETIECIYYYKLSSLAAVTPTPTLSPLMYFVIGVLVLAVGVHVTQHRRAR